jgi:hypothetical protein
MVEPDLSCCVKEFFMPCDRQRLAVELDKMMEYTGKSDMILISVCCEGYFGKQDKILTRRHCRGRKRGGRRSGPI